MSKQKRRKAIATRRRDVSTYAELWHASGRPVEGRHARARWVVVAISRQHRAYRLRVRSVPEPRRPKGSRLLKKTGADIALGQSLASKRPLFPSPVLSEIVHEDAGPLA